MIAGLHSHNGVYFGDDPAWKVIPADHETLATYLHSMSYNTTAALTNPHLTSERNFDSGFDEFENLRLAGDTNRAAASRSSQPDSPVDRIRTVLGRRSVLDSVPVVTAGRAYQYLSEWPSIRAPTVLNALFDRGRYGHPRHYPYDELLHVSLLIRSPKGGTVRLSTPFSVA